MGAKADSHFILYACICLLVPYLMLWAYFSWHDKNNLSHEQFVVNKLDRVHNKDIIRIPDEKGELRTAVTTENLFYIESFKNYVIIHYLNDSRLSHFLIRNRIKTVDEKLTTDSSLVRCHCNYIINVEKVRLLHKDRGVVTLELSNENSSAIPDSSRF